MSDVDSDSGRRLKAALDLALRGWSIVPMHSMRDGNCTCYREDCPSPGKHPLINNGVHGATSDATLIREWLAANPDANLAVRTGPESGVWVLDADGPEGVEAITALEAEHGPLPRTPTARTGGGGRHYYFSWPTNAAVRSRTRLGGRPIDVRGSGGCAVVPPSVHASGAPYRWEISPEEVDPAPAPGWLLDLATQADRPTAAHGRASSLADDPGVEEGRRHDTATRLIGTELARGRAADEIRVEALAWAARCSPPMPVAEITRIVDDLAARDEASREAEWEPPMSLDDPDPPSFPLETLPEWVRHAVESVAVATQTPPDLGAMLALSVLAATGARLLEVRVAEGYREPLNLFVVVALPPGNRKSAVFGLMVEPLAEFEAERAILEGPELAEARTLRDIEEKRLASLQAMAAKVEDPAERQAMVSEAAELARGLAERTLPAGTRVMTDDTTAERLAGLLQQHGGRMAVFSPEGELFDLMAGRYGSGSSKAGNYGVYLKGHAGDDLRVDRVGRPPEFVSRPALTIGLAVQPEVIRGLADKPGFRGRGLLARFLYSMPRSLVGHRNPDPPPVSAVVLGIYRRRIRHLLGHLSNLEAGGPEVPYQVGLTPTALRIRFLGHPRSSASL